MMPLRLLWAMLAVAALATGCVTAPAVRMDYSRLYDQNPRSILIVPAVNRSVDVDAPNYYLSTIARPVAERGYYVFPVHLVKRILEDDGLADAALVHQADPARLGEMFGADAIMYVTIERWDAMYAIVSTTVIVEFSYVLKSAKTGEVLWKNSEQRTFTPQQQNNSNGLLANLIAAAITRAAPNYIPLTQQANANAVAGPRGLPYGPLHPRYHDGQPQTEGATPAGSGSGATDSDTSATPPVTMDTG